MELLICKNDNKNLLRLRRLLLDAGVGFPWPELNPLVAELSEPNKSPNKSGPEACRDELTLEPIPEPDPTPNGSNKSPMAAAQMVGMKINGRRLCQYSH